MVATTRQWLLSSSENGEKLRRLAKQAQLNGNQWSPERKYMKAVTPWQPSQAVLSGACRVNGGNIYICIVAGTTSANGGPTGSASSGFSDGSAIWTYWGKNSVTTDPYVTQSLWAASASATLGQQVIVGSASYGQNVYGCVATATYTFTVSGITVSPTNGAVYTNNAQTFYVISSSIVAGSGTIICSGTGAPATSGTLTKTTGTGDATIAFSSVATATTTAGSAPTGTGNQVVDNGVVWTYLGVYIPSQYYGIMPAINYISSAPTSPQTNVYSMSRGFNQSALRAVCLNTGSNYAVNDLVTLALGGGTVVTSTVLQITSIASTVVFTVSGVTTTPTAGAVYTNNGFSFTVTATSITGGNGTVTTTTTAGNTPTSSGTLTRSSGTGDATVTFSAATVTTGVPQTCSVSTPGVYTALEQATPYWSQGSTTGSGTGATFTVAFTLPGWCNLFGANPQYFAGGAFGTGSGISWNPTTTTAKTADMQIEFYTDSQNVVLSGISNGYQIVIDGISLGLDWVGTNSGFTAINLDFTNCGGPRKRLFEIFTHSGSNLPGVIVNLNSTVWAPDQQDIISINAFSDSLWDGSSYGPNLSGNSTALRFAREIGARNICSYVQGGTGYVNNGTSPLVASNNFGSRIAQAFVRNPNANLWVFMGSTNDIGTATATITATAVSVFQAIRSGGSTAPIVVFGLWSLNNAGLAAVEAAMAQAVTTFADPLGKTFFIPIYNDPYFPWVSGSWNNNPAPSGISNQNAINSNSYISGDNTHPPDPGTEYLGKRLAQAAMTYVLPYL